MRPRWSAAGLALLLLLSLAFPGGGASAAPPTVSSCPVSASSGVNLGSLNGSGGALAARSADPRAVPNRGFATNLTMFLMPSPVPKNATFLVLSEEVVGTTLLAMGLVALSTLGPYPLPFWAVLDNTTGALVTCGVGSYSPTPGTPLDFRAEETNGTTWSVTMNGSPFGGSASIPLNASEATWTGGIALVSLAAYNGTAWIPGAVDLPQALTVLTGVPYYLPSPVTAFWTGRAGTSWGEAGTSQNGSLPLGTLQVGSALAFPPNGTVLWQRPPPVPANVTVSVSPSTVSGGASAEVSARATHGGRPLSGQALVWSSSSGGSFGPAPPTDADGWSNTSFVAPVLSITGTVELTATLTGSAFVGTGSANVTVLSSQGINVTLVAQAVPSSGPPGENLTVTLRATVGNAPGGSVPLAPLEISVETSPLEVEIAPQSPWSTNASGVAVGHLLLPAAPGTVEVTFQLTSPGYRGRTTLNLTVTPAAPARAPSGLSSLEEGMVILGVVAALALVAVAWVLRRRRTARDPGDPPTPPGTLTACPGCGAPVPTPTPRFCPACGVPFPGTRDGNPPSP